MSKDQPSIDKTFGANAFRLSMRGWLLVTAICVLFCSAITPVWNSVEQVDYGADYRVPYELSRDYWLYARHLDHSVSVLSDHGRNKSDGSDAPFFVLGDSVIWGEYVRADGTLSHFLNQRTDTNRTFVNAGINGLFPLALEGLVRFHAPMIRHSDVLLHCNLLWMSNPDADMSSPKEQTFNHVALVPQFRPQVPCYRGSRNERLGIAIRRQFNVFEWVKHLQQCYFEKSDIPAWTLKSDGQFPAHYPNANRLPFGQVSFRVPGEAEYDPTRGPTRGPSRGPDAERHRAWHANGMKPQAFEWVDPTTSLQWAAFQRLSLVLKSRGNRVRVVVGPFNEHMVSAAGKSGLEQWKRTVRQWCEEQDLSCQLPSPLTSDLYGDASHPLTQGYAELARAIELE